MSSYELFETTADVGVRGFGSTLEEAFENAAKAMFSVMVDLSGVKEEREVEVSCEAFDEEGLLVEWLNELLALSSIEKMVFSSFEVKIDREDDVLKLKGVARGEKLDPGRHNLKTEVKAATYSMIKVVKEGDRYVAQLILDI
ncbi:MAG: archease [Thermoprotei archaeon]|nr:MAG: archease [Thermoprotei archaeon]RLF17379.1 MAG: archease [Thermoprotei archaeon]